MESSAWAGLFEVVGSAPGKVIAVHLNYPSRCAERGRTPSEASYFLKPTSSLTLGGVVERPDGFELLAFEGEVAVVVGTAARHVSPEDGWSHVGWVTASNDLGLQDLRYADKGSNLRSKGGDGFTAVGPRLLPAAQVRPDGLRLRTWLDGELVQDDTTDTLLFPVGHLIADLSRVITLHPGDIILTGTPAGASVTLPGQRVQVEVSSVDDPSVTTGRLVTDVIAGPAPGPWGSPPKADETATEEAWGSRRPPSAPESTALADTTAGLAADSAAVNAAPAAGFQLTDDLRERLTSVAVATLSVQLRKRGFGDSSIDGVRPLVPGHRFAGPARTLRYIAYRKDLFDAKGGGFNAQKRVIDTLEPGEVLVMEARGQDDAGTLGDILALRAKVRGAAGVVTDGAVRDWTPVAEVGLPVLAAGPHPSVLGRRHVPWETDVTVSCGGTPVEVGDIVVAGDDGAVVIPPALVVEVLEDAEDQERQETFIAEMVAAGESVDGLYPIGPPWKDRYQQWLARRL